MEHEHNVGKTKKHPFKLVKGFKWVAFDEIKSLFPVPKDWHICFEKKKASDEFSAYITKENYIKTGKYFTGIYIDAEIKRQKTNCYEIIRRYRKIVEQDFRLLEIDSLTTGIIYGERFLFEDYHNKVENRKMRLSHLKFNENTNSFYDIMYICPAEDWEESGWIGRYILERYRLSLEM